MTRAAALALRAGAGLRENCVVVITDGPVIGTAGNTSITEIELNPTGPSELGLTARVHTTFSPNSWPGVYDVDANTITELEDDFGNHLKDVDAGGATIANQFPWHLGSATLRDNVIEDSTLTGWDTQVGSIIGNTISGADINLTGRTAGAFSNNDVGPGVQMILGAAAASATVQGSRFRSPFGAAALMIQHDGAGTLSIQDSLFDDGFAVRLGAAGGLTIADMQLKNHSTTVFDIAQIGGGLATFNDGEFIANSGAGQPVIDNQAAVGTCAVARSRVNGTRFFRNAAAVGSMSVQDSRFETSLVQQNAGATVGALSITGSVVASGSVIQSGPGAVSLTNVDARSSTIQNAAGATRGLTVQSGSYNSGTVTQNRTGGTAVDSVADVDLTGQSVVNFNGAVDPGLGQTVLNRVRIADTSTVTITDPAAVPVVFQNADVVNSTIAFPAGAGLATGFRVFRAGLNMGAFAHSDVIIDGPTIGTKTFTAANVGKLLNLAFDNTI